MNLHTFKIRGDFCRIQTVSTQIKHDRTSYIYIYTRGELTIGAKRLVGAKQSVGKRLEAKRLGEETIWGQNVPDSPKQVLHK